MVDVNWRVVGERKESMLKRASCPFHCLSLPLWESFVTRFSRRPTAVTGSAGPWNVTCSRASRVLCARPGPPIKYTTYHLLLSRTRNYFRQETLPSNNVCTGYSFNASLVPESHRFMLFPSPAGSYISSDPGCAVTQPRHCPGISPPI